MSTAFEEQWKPLVEQLRRRKHAEGKVLAVGAFLSAAKEAFPLMEKMEVMPGLVEKGTLSTITENVLAQATVESVPKAIRRGLAKKFITELLLECTREPVTDEEVKAGVEKGEAEAKSKLEERRAARAAAENSERGNTAGSADDGGDDAGSDGRDQGRSQQTRTDGPDENDEEAYEDDLEEEEERTESESSFASTRRRAETSSRRQQAHHHEDNVNENDENDDVLEEEDGPPIDEVDERPPSRRRARPPVQQPQPQVVYVAPPPAPRPPKSARTQQPRSSFFPATNDMVRIYKRIAGGRRMPIGEYTKEDIGPGISLQMFLKDYIDPENSETNGRTTYECVQLDARGNEIGRPVSYTIDSQPQDPASQDMFGQVRNVMDLLGELRSEEEERAKSNVDLLNQAKQKAVAGGDMSQMMMLMMMDRIMSPPRHNDEAIVRAVLDKMGHANAPPPQPLMMPTPLPPPMPMPPVEQKSSAIDKLLEASIAAMLKPEKSLVEQLREMEVLRSILHPQPAQSAGETALLLKTLLEQQKKPAEVAGVDSMMLTFEKLTTMVKALAPQINQGGWSGPIQGILNQPQVQEALANVMKGVMGGATAGGAQVQPQQPQLPQPQQPVQRAPIPLTQPVAVQAQPPAQQQPQVPKPTPEMLEAAKKFAIAQTKEFRITALEELVQVMYMGGWAPFIEPILAEAMEKGNVAPAQQFIHALINDIRPDLATLDLVNSTLLSMAGKAGERGEKVVAALKVAAPAAAAVAPAPNPPGTIETQNAKVIPIRESPPDPNAAAYAAQVEELRKRSETVPPASAAPAPVPAAAPTAAPTPPAEVTHFEKEKAPPTQQQQQPTAS